MWCSLQLLQKAWHGGAGCALFRTEVLCALDEEVVKEHIERHELPSQNGAEPQG